LLKKFNNTPFINIFYLFKVDINHAIGVMHNENNINPAKIPAIILTNKLLFPLFPFAILHISLHSIYIINVSTKKIFFQ